MASIFIATATVITTTGQYEDIETDVSSVVVSARTSRTEAESDLLDRAKALPAPEGRTELRLSITELDLELGHVISETKYRAVPTLTLEPESSPHP